MKKRFGAAFFALALLAMALFGSACVDCDDDDDGDVYIRPCVCNASCYQECDLCNDCGPTCYDECDACCR